MCECGKTLPDDLGTVSEGTTRHVDILPLMVTLLEEVCPDHSWLQEHYAYTLQVGHTLAQVIDPEQDVVSRFWDLYDSDYELIEKWGYEWVSAITDELYNLLNDHSPDGYYFGMQEGDGACLGLWPIRRHEGEPRTV